MSVRVRFPSGAREQASQTTERPVFFAKGHTYILRKCVELAINKPPQNIYY